MLKSKKIVIMPLIISLLLAVIIPLTPVTAFASSQNQITAQGSTQYYNSIGAEVTASPVLGNNAVVSVAKTIEGTNNENEFLMTLDVKTSLNISEVKASADAAVVLVLDISGSMLSYIAQLKTAANNFLDSYAAVEGEAVRYVSLVVFATDAKIVRGWVDVSNTQNLADMKLAVNSLGAEGATFVEGGLVLARNLLRTDALPKGTNGEIIENCSAILFSDGEANKYTSYTTASYNVNASISSTAGPGNLPDATSQSRAATMANAVKNQTSFTVGSTYQKHNAYLFTIAFGSGAPVTWLQNKIATNSSFAYSASNASDLNAVFAAIAERIESWAQAWVITDPMGENIEFISTISQNDINTGLLKFENNVLSWDLKKANPNSFVNNVYTYTYKYLIRLDTTSSSYVPGKSYVTNGNTDLTYVMLIDGKISSDVMTAYFSVPAVKGYAGGSFDFTKVGGGTEILAGCEFTLVNQTKTNYEFLSVSKPGTGKVDFTNIPSGYTYKLSEISMPNTYKGAYRQSTEVYTVTVSYGDVIIRDGKGNIVDSGFKFNNPVHGRTVTGLVWPMVVGDLGRGREFLDKHDIVVELRSSFQVAASFELSVTAALIDSSGLGKFTIEDVPPGEYVLYIKRPGYLTRSMMVTVSVNDADIIELAPPGTEDGGVFNLWFGDSNGDGVVDNRDIMLVIEYMGLQIDINSNLYEAYVDLNADGIIDNRDAMLIIENFSKSIRNYSGAEYVDFAL